MGPTVLITGASSGIGAAVAARYARQGAQLALIARNEQRLAFTEANCRHLGAADVRVAAIDVADRAALGAWIEEFDRAHPVDTIVANAGILAGISRSCLIEDAEASYRLYQTNVMGVINTIHPLLPPMVARGRGRIGIISSLAAFVPLAHMPSYSASKACVLSYGQSLRTLLRPHGIRVSVICPGFVATAMTEQVVGDKPFLISPEEAAERIVAALGRGRAMTVFPFFFGWLTRLGGVLPVSICRLGAPEFVVEIRSGVEGNGRVGPIEGGSRLS